MAGFLTEVARRWMYSTLSSDERDIALEKELVDACVLPLVPATACYDTIESINQGNSDTCELAVWIRLESGVQIIIPVE